MSEIAAGRPRILFVTGALVTPPYIGCMKRVINVCRQLGKCSQVSMLGVSRKFNSDSVALCNQQFKSFHQIQLKPYSESLRGGLLHKFHMHWPYSRGIQANTHDKELFCQLVAKHDIVWFHTLASAMPFGSDKISNSVMDLDDLNHCKYELRSQDDQTLRLRLSSRVQAFQWKRHEFGALRAYNTVVVCSEQDKEYLGGANIQVVPNGFTMPQQKPKRPFTAGNILGFIGELRYPPNRSGLIWFRDNVWPLIRKYNPQMRFRIIGLLPEDKYRVQADGFEYLGFVPDPTDEMETWAAMVVPLTYGGGTRIKIIEAFTKMCPVVSTPTGAYGIQARNKQHLLVADTPEQFADDCLKLTQQPHLGRELAEKGWQLFVQKYDWDVIGVPIREIIEKLTKDA